METLTRTLLPPLIGITGRKGAGKDTVADHLVEIFGYRKHSFADPIKKALALIFGVPDYFFHDPSVKEVPHPLLMGRSPRYLMQTLGTEWGRDLVISDLWARLLIRTVEDEAACGHHYAVVPDVRFDSEAQAIKESGGLIWEVTRPDALYSTDDTHRSERGIDRKYIDTVLENNSDTRMLFTQIGVAITHATRKLYRPDDGSAV